MFSLANTARRGYTGPCKHMIAEMITADILESREAVDVTSWLVKMHEGAEV